MMTLKGHIRQQTDKAVLLEIENDMLLHLQGKKHWFPKSKIKMSKSRDNLDVVRLADWLYDSKLRLNPDAM